MAVYDGPLESSYAEKVKRETSGDEIMRKVQRLIERSDEVKAMASERLACVSRPPAKNIGGVLIGSEKLSLPPFLQELAGKLDLIAENISELANIIDRVDI